MQRLHETVNGDDTPHAPRQETAAGERRAENPRTRTAPSESTATTSADLEITASVDQPLSVNPSRPDVRESVEPPSARSANTTPSAAAGSVSRWYRNDSTSSSAMT